jgi:AcrR family transcriptional regulator
MALKKKASHPRISREEASERLVNSTISLLDSRPMNEILVDVIAEHAGLASGHVLVHRYFGSRAGLLSTVVHRLSTELIEELNAVAGGLQGTSTEPSAIFLMIGANIALIRKRAILIGELSLHGADPAPHAGDMSMILDALESVFALSGMSHRVARATALNMYTLISVEASQLEWSGATQELRADLRNLTLMELGYASEIGRQLGWE